MPTPEMIMVLPSGAEPNRQERQDTHLGCLPSAAPGMLRVSQDGSEGSAASEETAPHRRGPYAPPERVAGLPAPCLLGTGEREWLYHLVTFPAYFTPCAGCCGPNRTPKREQLITHFDTENPTKVYCSHCPEHKVRLHALLQIRRSAFKDVVKANDIQRFGADISGVQQYTLNGSKVVYLSREASSDKKSAGANGPPAVCIVDGRAMMDKSSLYCSVKCKMCAEDPTFLSWMDRQDPSVLEAAAAAASAPPRPTVASKRAAPGAPTSSCERSVVSSGGGGASSGARAKKVARTHGSGGSVTGCSLARPVARSRATKAPSKASHKAGAGVGGMGVQLKPIKTRLPSVPSLSAFAVAAGVSSPGPLLMDDDLLVPGSEQGAWGAAPSINAFNPELAHAMSSTAGWGQLPSSGDDAWRVPSPSFALGENLGGSSWGEGPLSPVLGGGSSGSSDDWWLGQGAFGGEAGSDDDVLALPPLPESPSTLGGSEGVVPSTSDALTRGTSMPCLGGDNLFGSGECDDWLLGAIGCA